MTDIRHRPLETLFHTSLPWLDVHDHFVSTVGPESGQGEALGPLLVLADATFQPSSRFPLHSHEDVEILSVVVSGELSHHGDERHGAVLPARSAKLISARDGMRHAEGNDSSVPTRMLQIWFRPDALGGPATYHRRELGPGPRELVAGDEGMPLRLDAKVWWIELEPGVPAELTVTPQRCGYGVILEGPIQTKAALLERGDGIEVRSGTLELTSTSRASILWIDLPLP
jgi:redox-sensitive bicupin YhaK (pirin superfamily)